MLSPGTRDKHFNDTTSCELASSAPAGDPSRRLRQDTPTKIKAQVWQASKADHIWSDTHEAIDQRRQGFGCLAQRSVVGSLHFEQPFLQAPVHKPNPTTTSPSSPEPCPPPPDLENHGDPQLKHIPFPRLPFCIRVRSARLPLRAWAFVAAPKPSKHSPSKRRIR